jgi:hypothetical protein
VLSINAFHITKTALKAATSGGSHDHVFSKARRFIIVFPGGVFSLGKREKI